MGCWPAGSRVELIVIDELGHVPLAEVAAELLVQVIAERAEKAAIIVTTNLPFFEWPQVLPNRHTYRFRRTLRRRRKTKPRCWNAPGMPRRGPNQVAKRI